MIERPVFHAVLVMVLIAWGFVAFMLYRAVRSRRAMVQDRKAGKRTLDNTPKSEWVALLRDAEAAHDTDGRNACGHKQLDLDCASCVIRTRLVMQQVYDEAMARKAS